MTDRTADAARLKLDLAECALVAAAGAIFIFCAFYFAQGGFWGLGGALLGVLHGARSRAPVEGACLGLGLGLMAGAMLHRPLMLVIALAAP